MSLDDTSIEIVPTSSGYRLVVAMGSERRELADADCRQLFRTGVVVTLAMMQPETALSDARAANSSAQPAAESEPTKAAKGSSPARPPAAAPPARGAEPIAGVPRTPIGIELGLAAGVNAGLLPRPALELRLDGRLRWGAWGAALAARYLNLSARQDAQGRGVEVRAVGGRVAALYQPLPVCELALGVSADLLLGTGLGTPASRSDSAWALGPSAGISLYPLRRRLLWVGFGLEGQLDVVRPRFEILHYQSEVFRVPLWSGSAFFRVAHRFF
jgi:hypothetical protein